MRQPLTPFQEPVIAGTAQARLGSFLGVRIDRSGGRTVIAVKKIRDDGNYWHRVESYIAGHANVRFSHGICPSCLENAMKAARGVGHDHRLGQL